MPEKLGDKIQNVFRTICDAADVKCVQPLKRQVFNNSPSGSPRKSPIKSPLGASSFVAVAELRRASEGQVRFEDCQAELPLKRKLELELVEQRRRSTSSPRARATEEVSEFKLRELKRERDALREQVSSLANFNYAREPEFVRDRLKLRELSQEVQRMLRHLQGKHIEPVLSKVAGAEERLAQLARRYEEESELMAKEFLEAPGPLDESQVDKFINEYVDVRKQASKRRILADRLARERSSLANLSAGFLG